MNFKKIIVLGILLLLFVYTSAQKPQRIVSLVPAISKQLYELGLKDRIVGCTSYCPGKDRPGVSVVASAIKVNIEKTVLLKPDLVLASSLTNPKTLETLKKLGIKTIWFDYPKSYADLCRQFLELGKITGKENKARQIVNKSDTVLAEIKRNITAVKPMSWLIQVGANPLWVAVGQTFMDDYIKFAKAVNVAKVVKSGAVSRESMILSNPDVIFICMAGTQAEEEKQLWLSYKSMHAAQNSRVFIIDPNLSNSPSPSSFVMALEKMMDLAYNM